LGAARRYRVRWWGPFGFLDISSGADCLPRGRRARAILAMATSRPASPIDRSELAAMFWGDRGDEQARASVRQSLAELRHLTNGAGPALIIDQTSVTLIPDKVVTFTEQLDELSSTGSANELEALLANGNGFLAGLDGISGPFDDWLRTERAHALDLLIAAGAEAARIAIGRDNHTDAQRLVNRLQAIDPLDERTARAGFEADSAASDAASLQRRMRMLQQHLDEELNVAPSPITVEAYRAACERLKGAPAKQVVSEAASPSIVAAKRPIPMVTIAGLVLLLAVAVLLYFRNADGESRLEPRTIAVVPFAAPADQKDISDGVAEEIVSRLSRNPMIAPLGRNSARMIGDDPSSAIALGRELRVNYLLTGTLANRVDRISIVARLIRTSDGEPVWTRPYAGSMAELVPLMNLIGSDVSERLGAGRLPQPRSRPPRQEAAQLYYRANSLLRGVEPQNVSTAVELLRQAVRLDPDYATAWSLLGMATRTEHLQHLTPEGDPDSILIPQAYARRGLELAPDSAEANLAMGDTLAEDPRSLPYVLRAAQLDPNNAAIWQELAEKYEKAGDFRRTKHAFDQAARIDPLWTWVVLPASWLNWNLGHRKLALQQVQQVFRHGQPQPHIRHMLRGDLAFRLGDFSRALEEYSAAARSTDAAGRVWADSGQGGVYFAVGMFEKARPLVALKAIEADFDLFEGRPPSQATVEISRKHPFYAWNMQERNYFLLRLLVNHRRFAEVAALYDRRFKSPEEFSNTPRGHESFLNDSVPVVLALRQVDRKREADRIQAIALAEIEKRYRAGVIPMWYEALAAQHFAMAGDRVRAIEALERAIRKGWFNRGYLAMPDMAAEPAFRSLAGNPRYDAIQRRLADHYARERNEVLAVMGRQS
jgi:DNA-binding SARP family transcriptional activator/TolB-like protein/tetratricopeptide (TPR) repeat protein